MLIFVVSRTLCKSRESARTFPCAGGIDCRAKTNCWRVFWQRLRGRRLSRGPWRMIVWRTDDDESNPDSRRLNSITTHTFSKSRKQPSSSTNYSLVSIALVTVSNGADNVGVYVPFFLVSRAYLWVILIAYAVLIALWCFAGRWLGNHSVFLRFD